MRIGLISPMSGVPTKYPFEGYGGIERIVADLSHAFRDMGHYVYLMGYNGSDAGTDNQGFGTEQAIEFLQPVDLDVMFDFSHLKRYRGPKYSIPFWSDAMGDNPIFPTYAVRWSFNADDDVVYPGVDISKYQLSDADNADHYVYVGRIAPYKGIDTILYLMKHLHIDVRFYGHTGRYADASYVRYVSDRLRQMKAEPIHSDISEQEKADALSHSRGLIFPPDWSLLGYSTPRPVESFGIVAVEALASGVPVFTNNLISGVREIIAENAYGLTLDMGQWHDMMGYESDGESQRERAKFFSAKRYATRLLDYVKDKEIENADGKMHDG